MLAIILTSVLTQGITSSSITLNNINELAAANTAFAVDLYSALPEEGNLFFSPLSIYMALAMTSAGARGDTLAQMEEAIHFPFSQEQLHPAFRALMSALENRQYLPDDRGEGFTLNLVNSIWAQKGYAFLADFLDVLKGSYGTGVRLADFAADPDAVRDAINMWVEEATHDRIVDLIPQGAITKETLLALVNAIYFNAPWAFPFDEQDTELEPFTLLDGTEVEVPLMHETELLGYAEGDQYQAVELDYNGNDLSMVVILPSSGAFEAVNSRLSPAFISQLIGDLSRENVILTLPKFTFEWSDVLNDTLAGLGMPDAFNSSVADFSGIDGRRVFFIGAVIHKAFVSVDEAGTEAAAATKRSCSLAVWSTQSRHFSRDRIYSVSAFLSISLRAAELMQ
jgi:serpin B